jgi:hypothetical protein
VALLKEAERLEEGTAYRQVLRERAFEATALLGWFGDRSRWSEGPRGIGLATADLLTQEGAARCDDKP